MADYSKLKEALTDLTGSPDSQSGVLGYSVNGIFRVVDPDDPTRFFVRFANGNWVSALHKNRVAQKPGLPVLVGLDNIGRPVILGEDPTKAAKFTAPGSSGSAVGYHTHVRGSGMEYITDTWLLKQLRVTANNGTVITIAPGAYLYRKALKWFSGGTINVFAYEPSTFGAQVWIIIGLNPVTGEIVAVAGDSYVSDAPSDPALIPLVPFYELGYIPLAAVSFWAGDVNIPNYRVEDLRYAIGSPFWVLEDLFNVDDDYAAYGYVLEYGYDGRWSAQPAPASEANSDRDIWLIDYNATIPTGVVMAFPGDIHMTTGTLTINGSLYLV